MNDDARIGAPRKRKEDPRFLTGASCFTDDVALAGQLHAVVVRSPHAHARIRAVDTAAARSAPGVRLGPDGRRRRGRGRPANSLVLAHAALRHPRARWGDGPRCRPVPARPGDGALRRRAGRVRRRRDAGQAHDAAELVTVDYEPRPAAIGFEQALAVDAPRVWDDRPGNVSFEWEGGAGDVEAAFARAAHVTRVEVVNNRIAPVFMEPRSAVAEYDPATSRWTLRVGCQSAHGMRAVLVHVMGIGPERLRVVVPDTGGGFGARAGVYPEYPLLLVAARRLGRPVKWTAERTEAFLADHQARDHVLRGELALDGDGRFTAMRVHADWRHGAYLTSRNVWVMVHYLPPTLGGPYRIPCGHAAHSGRVLPHHAARGLPRHRPHRGELPHGEPDRGGGARDRH